MELNLSNLKSYKRKKRKRIGRGDASGYGTYAGRGQKGQKSRSGGKRGLKRKGLKLFLKQIPKKRGFKSFYPKIQIVNIGDLNKKFTSNELITPRKLVKVGLIRSMQSNIKILGHGKLTKKFNIKAHKFSKSAENAIKKVGGKIELIK